MGLARLDDPRFIAGFGSNGGEEFLSYMNISETLVVKGGAEWEKWDKSVADNLNRVQDKDGHPAASSAGERILKQLDEQMR